MTDLTFAESGPQKDQPASEKQSEKGAAISAFLEAERQKGLLRFLTCGSVDDGKSTLIGRLLYDSQLIFDDQLKALHSDSRKLGTTGGDLDLALLVDGLQAEREQGITIDVAYRYFSTPRRKFIVADTPGHEQFTRNMATGASTSDLAIILVDARQGLLTQTRRHSCIVSLLGIRHVVLAVNKMDLCGYDQHRFEEISEAYQGFVKDLGISHITAIPVSALKGDMVVGPSENMSWYQGPSLLEHLETVDVSAELKAKPFRFPVQWVNRPSHDFRGYSGSVSGGKVRAGDKIIVLPSAKTSTVASIVTADGDLERAESGQAVTLTLQDELDISRGDILCAPESRPELADQIAAHLVWMSEDPLLPGRSYLLRSSTQTAVVSITDLKYKLNVDTLEHVAGKTLELNEVGFCNLSLNKPLVFDAYADNRDMGGFVLIDKLSNATVAAGMISFALRRATNIQWQALDINQTLRAELKGQKAGCLWFTGLSGSGKSTIANVLEKKLHALGRHTYVLDGDNVRHGLNRDLGFTDADRVENIRRVAECAKLFVEAGLLVMVSFISPFRSERRMARELFEEGAFLEIFVDTPLEICEQRDAKGLYKKARAGEIKNFTGISSAYEEPERADLVLKAGSKPPEELIDDLLEILQERKMII